MWGQKIIGGCIGLVVLWGVGIADARLAWAGAGNRPGPGGWSGLSRDVLVVYFGINATADDNNFRSYWDFPLNYLGFKATYKNMRRGFPRVAEIGRYRAVFLQIGANPIPDTLAYWSFVESCLDAHVRVVLLEDFPVSAPTQRLPDQVRQKRTAVLSRMGLRVAGVWKTDNVDLVYGHRDPAMEGFEYPLPARPPEFRPLVSVSPANRIFLGVQSDGQRNAGLESVYALSAPWGGLVLDPFMIRWNTLDVRLSMWYVNPFRFLEAALGIARTPRMDLTTLNGDRIFYSQVDGDAFETLSRYERRKMSAEVLYQKIFKKTPLPFTVSVIVSQVDPAYQGSSSRVYWARKIFALPNVEAGSHTFSHPFFWVPTKVQEDEGPTHIVIRGYTFNLRKELNGSIDWINRNLLPPGKRVRVLQWSGNTRPGEDALAQLATTGVLNLNGADSRFDENAPSYTFVEPYFRRVGRYVQYFNSDANDYILTNDWSGPYFGYLNVIRTFQRTDRPKRVDPINVYFHFYAGQRESALNALRQVLAWAMHQPIAPLFSSGFVEVEQGFIGARIDQGPGRSWRIRKYGHDLTVRFDHAAELYPDLEGSRGVIGFRHRTGSLYLYLAPEGRVAEIRLTAHAPEKRPWLSRATGVVRVLAPLSRKELRFAYDGWEPQDRVVFAGLSHSAEYRLVAEDAPLSVHDDGRGVSVRSDGQGRIVLGEIRPHVRYRLVRSENP